MNKRTAPAMAGILALGLILASCATFESNAYKTISTITTTVEAARKGWVDYVTQQRPIVAGNPEQAKALEIQVAKVQVIYEEYQTAMDAAKAAVAAYRAGNGTQNSVNLVISTLSAASGKIIALIGQITSSTKTAAIPTN